MEKILSMTHISKSFPGVQALDDVSIDFYGGEVHALVGENGAGKSTLMKILAGLYQADSGEILLGGREVHFHHAVDALRSGVAMVHQEFMPIAEMTVAENIFLGREPTLGKTGVVDKRKMEQDVRTLAADLNIEVNPRDKMKELSVAQRQLVEIAKAISCQARIIVMDEPTSAITEKEAQNLLHQIRRLADQEVSIIYISHKMDEILEIADRITVLRDGKKISEKQRAEVTINSLIKDMVGRELDVMFPPAKNTPGKVCFCVEHLNVEGLLDDINFELRQGEVLGIAGLMGAGRTELAESIFGIRKITSGTIKKDGRPLQIHCPEDAIRNRIALVPEDRKLVGLNLIATVKENLSVAHLKQFTRFGLVNRKKEKIICQEIVDKLRIKTPGLNQKTESLSGGNQQKIVIGKWLLTDSDILILDDPTRGIDVNAKHEIYELIRELTGQNKSIILISSEMPEIIGLCDRAMVMCEGRISKELQGKELTQEQIMTYASGIT